MTVSISGTGGVTFNDNSVQNTAATGFGFKNRLINGAMVIDQRNAGASVSASGSTTYFTDRWSILENTDGTATGQQSTTAPTGFSNSLLFTVTSADSSLTTTQQAIIRQPIEGFNTSDLSFGTANAQTVTLSFWVRSSVTGTFSGSLRNSANDRSYPFTYAISAANTFEQKTVTIAGDTSGTWVGATNGIGLEVIFSLGAGPDRSGTANAWAASNLVAATGATNLMATNGATFYITGVQLEKGSTATSFDYRPYGTELQLCYRYYYEIFPEDTNSLLCTGYVNSSTTALLSGTYPATMRVAPTALEQSGTASNYRVVSPAASANCSAVPTFTSATNKHGFIVNFTVASGLTTGQGATGRTGDTTGASGYLAWSAEL
jgi:hypothetical protein